MFITSGDDGLLLLYHIGEKMVIGMGKVSTEEEAG